MVSKNNTMLKEEKAASRQSHFGIRKLTIGAASVLLGTTLWLSNGNTAQAASVDENANNDNPKTQQGDQSNTSESNDDSNIVVAESNNSVTDNNVSSSVESNQSEVKAQEPATTTIEKNDSAKIDSLVKSKNDVTTDDNNINVNSDKATVNTSRLTGKADSSTVVTDPNLGRTGNVNKKAGINNKVETKQSTEEKVNDLIKNEDKAAVKQQTVSGTAVNNAAIISDSGQSGKTTIKENDGSTFNYNLDAAALRGVTIKGKQNLAKLFNTSLVQTIEDGQNQDKAIKLNDDANKIDDTDFETAATWNDVEQAAFSGAKGVKLTSDVTAFGDLNINSTFTIEGTKKGDTYTSLNLGPSSIVNNGNLTLADITVNGSITGNGQVTVEGTVNSNVDGFNSKKLTNSQLNGQIGTNRPGANVNNWKAANIQASRVEVAQGATLNINRSITGDGIAEPNNGYINVGINASLNINLKDAKIAARYNEQNVSLDNANAGVRILDNGTFTSGDSAQININAGHGRAIVVNEKFGGTTAIHNNILATWENGRTGNRNAEAAKHHNVMTLGDSTKMNITGRGGILLGFTANFTTGDHSIIHIDNQGNGEGLLLDANSIVEVSPHSQLLMTSNGKNCTGSYDGGNYIGMGSNAKFRVEHDATFRYKLTNAGNGAPRPWSDNFNIISQVNGAHPEVYVGPNATFDGQSDYAQFNGEIFSFSLDNGAGNQDYFTIDGAQYVNWQRNAVVPSSPGPVGGTAPQGNLYYSMAPSIIGASGREYYIFKWNNADLAGSNLTYNDATSEDIKNSIDNFKNSSYEWWHGVTHLATKYSKRANTAEGPGHNVSASDITGVDTIGMKRGISVNSFSDRPSNDTGFDPKNSQRLVLVANIIPTQVDDTHQDVDPYQVQVKYDKSLQPGQVKLVQQGINGLKRTTKTTYYNVDPATGKKTLDTSKGDNGVTTTTTVLNKKQDEVIYIGPQTATIGYYHKDNDTETPVESIGTEGIVTISGSPVKVNAQGDVEFDPAGNAEAAEIKYDDAAENLATAEENGYTSVIEDQWGDSEHLYNVTGLTKKAIQDAAEKAGLNKTVVVGKTTVNDQNPNFKIVVAKPDITVQQANLKFVDEDGPDYDATNPYASPTLTVAGVKTTFDASGKAGTPIVFDQGTTTVQGSINDLTEKGYVLVSNDFTKGTPFDKDDKNDQHFVVIMKHGVAPVDPKNPGKPGEPINPDDPNGPKWPADSNEMEATVTRTINYVDQDNSPVAGAPDGQTTYDQSVTFTREGYVDKVTGKWVTVTKNKDGGYDVAKTTEPPKWSENDSHIFDEVVSKPTVTVDGKTLVVKTVTPVDQASGTNVKEITVNHATAPIKVIVKYGPKAAETVDGKVTYIDDSEDNKVLQTVPLSGEIGSKIIYNPEPTIKDYEDKGYKLVSNNVPTDGTYNKDPKLNDFEVHLAHNVEPINPDNPTPKPGEPINPNDPDGPKYPNNPDTPVSAKDLVKSISRTIHYVVEGKDDTIIGRLADPVTSTVEFQGEGYIDKVTGKWVTKDDEALKEGQNPITWTVKGSSDELAGRKSPSYNGYHLIGVMNVKNNKVGSEDTVDSNNNQDVVAVVATPNTAQPYNVYVVYQANGKIIPVDQDGNPIPDVPTPKYGTNEQDPKKVTPTDVPDIPGYQISKDQNILNRPEDTNPSTDFNPTTKKVTPTNPSKDTEVVYKKNTPPTPIKNGSVTVTFYDDTTNSTIPDVGYKSGEEPEGTPFTYNPEKQEKELEDKGYVYVKTDGTLPTDSKIPADNVVVTIHMEHGVQPVNPNTPPKDVPKGTPEEAQPKNLIEEAVRHIHYVLDDGSGKPDSEKPAMKGIPADAIREQTVTFTGNTYVDKITGKIVNAKQVDGKWVVNKDDTAIPGITWTANNNGEFAGFNSPIVKGYSVNPTSVGTQKAERNEDVTVYVVYKAKNPDVQQATVTVIYHDDTDNKNLPGGWTSGEQDEGTPVKYTQDDINKAIEGWEKKHYHYVRTDGTLPTTIPAQDTTVTVHLAHDMIPVNPNTPDKHGVNPDQLTETFTSTLHYETKAGKQLAPAAVQSSNWIRQVTVDAVTNKVVPDGEYTTKWQLVGNDDKYNNFNVPVEIGYIAEKTTKDGAPVTNIVPGQIKVQRNLEDTVIYDKLADIIPVDPAGNPIPGVPKTPYKNDPNNPTEVEPNEDSPQVPSGWTIEPKDQQPDGVTPDPETNTAKVTPQDPTKPTNVVYKKNTPPTEGEVKTSQTVNFVDEQGKKLQPSNIQNGFVFNLKDGKPTNGDSHTYNNVNVPVIQGYVADKNNVTVDANGAYVPGQKVTVQDPNVVVNVVYHKIGKIVPVGPDGKPIPGAPTPEYKNNPKVPTEVIPDEPIPDVPGYNPKNPGQKVTPENPTKDTEVPYDKITEGEVKTSQTVNFVDEQGKKLQPSNIQNGFVFNLRDGKPTNGDSHTYNNVNVPVIQGYVADKNDITIDNNGAYVPGQKVTVQDPNVVVNVVYHKIGKIVPVGPDGKPIPGAPTPEYKNNPKVPTEVIPDEPIPDVPGYNPKNPGQKVTPENPTKDTEVPYVPVIGNGRIVINYIDQDDNDAILDTATPTGKFGTKITYTTTAEIKKLENEGYVLVKDGYTDSTGHSEFTKENDNHVYEVIMKHGLEPINPDNPGKPGEPINPNDPNGPKYPAGSNDVTKNVTRTIHFVNTDGKEVSAPVTQTAHFTGEGVLDKVTGQWKTPITWSGDGKLSGYTSPVVKGYHVIKVSQDSQNNVNVAPVTVNVKTKDYTVTVTYAPNGHIIPVDQDGNPIPGADHPQFPTNPEDPGKVDDGKIPSVPGYEPVNGKPGEPVSPAKNPSDDVKIPYTKNPTAVIVTGSVTYFDKTTGKDLQVEHLKGDVGEPITYTTQPTIDDYLNKGYKFVSSNFKDGDETFKKTGNKFLVVLEHATVDVTPDNPGKPGEPINPNDPNGPKWPENTGKDSLEKTGTQTIKYVGAGSETPKEITDQTTFTRHYVVDKVTGKILNPDESWTPAEHTFKTYQTPVVKGYVANVKEAGGFKSTPADPNKTYTVTYKKIGKIIPVDKDGNPIPGAATPEYKNDPNDPTKVLPNEPVPTINGWQPSVPSVTPQDPTKNTPVVYNKDQTPTPVTPDNPSPQPTPQTPAQPEPQPESPIMPKGEDNPGEPEEPETTPVHGEEEPKPETIKPKGTIIPRGQKVVNSPVVPKSEVVTKAASVSTATKALPQTGDNSDEDAVVAALGGAAATLGLIGLAGVKRRHTN